MYHTLKSKTENYKSLKENIGGYFGDCELTKDFLNVASQDDS